jgi:hypothetical protein
MFARIMKLLTNPREYWGEVVAEPADIKAMLPQMAILAAIPALASFLNIIFTALRFVFSGGALIGAVVALLLAFAVNLGIWVAFGFIINALAPAFQAQKDQGQAIKLATGTIIPMWVGQVLNMIPFPGIGILGTLGGLGYGAYILYLGLPIMNGTSQEKAIPYTAASIGILFVVAMVAAFLVGCPAGCLMAASLTRLAY